MKNKVLRNYIIATIIPIIILLVITIPPLFTRVLGQEILLETIPRDPRNVFMGDHVILNYKINEIPAEKFKGNIEDLENRRDYRKTYESIFIVLKKNKEFYDVDFVTLEKPKQGTFLKIDGESYYYSPYSKTIHIDEWLNKFFVPENTGYNLENAAREGLLIAKAKVFNGNAVLVDVYRR